MTWNMGCEHAPNKETAIHCKKENEGKISASKAEYRGRAVGKGRFGCARHCRFFTPKGGSPVRYDLSNKKERTGDSHRKRDKKRDFKMEE